MRANSAAKDAVLAYAGTATAGQWFIPSMNELNELCKYARGQTTGVLTVACVTGSGIFKSTANAGSDLGGFVKAGSLAPTGVRLNTMRATARGSRILTMARLGQRQ